jgi:hypothetical protein
MVQVGKLTQDIIQKKNVRITRLNKDTHFTAGEKTKICAGLAVTQRATERTTRAA